MNRQDNNFGDITTNHIKGALPDDDGLRECEHDQMEDEMRKVEIYEYKQVKREGKSYWEKALVGTGLFHGWGVDYQEFESGAGNFSIGIVELPDGEIKSIIVECIKFMKD